MNKIVAVVTIGVFAVAFTAAGAVIVKKLSDKAKFEAVSQKWKELDEDVVVLHQFPRPLASISASPFPAKLETFLRIAKIRYICDFDYPKHPDTMKSPWISFKGNEIQIPDSQMAMEFLMKRFDKDLR